MVFLLLQLGQVLVVESIGHRGYGTSLLQLAHMRVHTDLLGLGERVSPFPELVGVFDPPFHEMNNIPLKD
jgi:hypothetical protein